MENIDISEQSKKILIDGYTTIHSMIDKKQIETLENEIFPWLNQINFNNYPGYSLANEDKWIHHLGICSEQATKLALSEQTLDLMEEIFDSPAILSEMSFHYSSKKSGLLPFHSDRDGGIILFLFLSDMNEDNGQFSLIPKTQNNDKYFYIPQTEIDKKKDQIQKISLKKGDVLIFDQDIWHMRDSAKINGRSVLKFLYHPKSRNDGAVDHFLRQSFLTQLTSKQLNALNIPNGSKFLRPSTLSNVGKPFSKKDIKAIFKYFLKYFRFSFKGQNSNQYLENKLRERPKRQRKTIKKNYLI